ncbi:MAG: hypothetical protein K0U93_27555, partial [Gammaproteobacteria bacterium]|nr:hypothetical protein [Gammaproteobacteria bacterium]
MAQKVTFIDVSTTGEGTAGVVTSASGNVTATDASGSTRALQVGDVVRIGDNIRVDDGGQASVQLADGTQHVLAS